MNENITLEDKAVLVLHLAQCNQYYMFDSAEKAKREAKFYEDSKVERGIEKVSVFIRQDIENGG